MKRYRSKVTAATLVATVAVLIGLSGCKGRTMDNMVPTGDTVEVEIQTTVGDSADAVTIDSAASTTETE